MCHGELVQSHCTFCNRILDTAPRWFLCEKRRPKNTKPKRGAHGARSLRRVASQLFDDPSTELVVKGARCPDGVVSAARPIRLESACADWRACEENPLDMVLEMEEDGVVYELDDSGDETDWLGYPKRTYKRLIFWRR